MKTLTRKALFVMTFAGLLSFVAGYNASSTAPTAPAARACSTNSTCNGLNCASETGSACKTITCAGGGDACCSWSPSSECFPCSC